MALDYRNPPAPDPFDSYEPTYTDDLTRRILTDSLPHEYTPPWYEGQFTWTPPTSNGQRASSTSQSDYQPPGFPLRAQVNLPWSSPEAPASNPSLGFLEPGAPLATALGGVGESRGGVVPGTAIANVPVNLANFTTWGRERTLALLTWAMSGGEGRYQQQPGQAFPTDTPARHGDLVDEFIGGLKTLGNTVWAPFEKAFEWWRTSNAVHRATEVQNLLRSGTAIREIGDVASVDWITSMITGGGGKFDSKAIQALAEQRGLSYLDMVAELYDLDPQIVYELSLDTSIEGDDLRNLVFNAPLSRNPVVNMALEFGIQMAALAVPYAGVVGRLGRAGAAAAEGAGFARGLLTGERVFQGAEEVSALQRMSQIGGWATKRVLQANSINNVAGWTIGGFEWGIKQIAVLGGNQDVVNAMDRAMWEMPLSMNPGLNIITAFGSHPLQSLGLRAERGAFLRPDTATGLLKGRVMIGTPGTPGEVGMLNLRTRQFERPIIDLPGATKNSPVVMAGSRLVRMPDAIHTDIRALATVDDLMPIFSQAGFERPWIEGLVSGPDAVPIEDLHEALLFIALSARRTELERTGLASVQAFGSAEDSALAFMRNNITGAHKLLIDSLEGRSTALADEFKGQWWEFAKLNDTRQAQIKAALADEYNPGTAFASFVSWLKASKKVREAYADGLIEANRTPVYVEGLSDANVRFIRSQWELLKRDYRANAVVPWSRIDQIKRGVGKGLENFGDGGRIVRVQRSRRPITRQQLDDILASVLKDWEKQQAAKTMPRAQKRVLSEGQVDIPMEQARVLNVSAESLDVLRVAESSSPEVLATMRIPRDVLAEVAKAEGMTPDALQADPVAAWPKVLKWFGDRLNDAQATGALRDTVDRFATLAKGMRGVDPPLMDAAAKGAKNSWDYLMRPPTEAWLKANPWVQRRLLEARQELDNIAPLLAKLPDAPEGKVGVHEGLLVPRDVPIPYVNDLIALIEKVKAEGRGLSEGDLAFLTEYPHPFFTLETLAKADLSAAERQVVERITLDSLAPVVRDVLGPDAVVTPETVAQVVAKHEGWLNDVRETAGQLAAVGDRFASIEGGGRSPEVADLRANLGERAERTGQPWQTERIKTTPVEATPERQAAANNITQRASINAKRNEAAQAVTDAEADLALLRERDLQPVFDFEKPEIKVYKGGKARAQQIAQRLQGESGFPTTWKKIGNRYEVYVGRLVHRTEAIQQTMDAGDVARSQALNIEEGIARGGTPESGGAVLPEAPTAAENPPIPVETPPHEQIAQQRLDEAKAALAQEPDIAVAGAAEPALTAEATPKVYGAERPFANPMDVAGADVPARFRLAELDDLTNSFNKDRYNLDLQPRGTERVGSESQIEAIAKRPKWELFLRSETGAEGTPVVGPDGMALTANHRIEALRRMSGAQLDKYRALIRARAEEFGLTPEQVDAMQTPVLVREVPAEYMTAEMASALNAATGGMTLTEIGTAVARQLTAETLSKLDLGDKVDLRTALSAEKNAAFVQRVLDALTPEQRRALSDAKGNLNQQGYQTISTALLAKVIPDQGIVARFVESLDEDLGRVRSGVTEALGQLTEAQALIASGVRHEELSIGPTLADAINKLLDAKARGVRAQDMDLELAGTQGMFETSPTVGELARALNGMKSVDEVRDFLRAYAKAVENSPDPTQIGMFAEQPPEMANLLNEALAEVNGLRREKYNEAVLRAKQKAQQGIFEENVRPLVELPGFTDAQGNIPARFQTSGGVEAIAQDVPIVESPEAAIAARMGPHAQHVIDGDPLDPASYAGAYEASGEVLVKVDNESYASALDALYRDPLAAKLEYRAARTAISTKILFENAALRLTRGEASGGDLLILRELSKGKHLRFNEAGVFNSKLDTAATLAAEPDLSFLRPNKAFRFVTEMPALGPDDAAVLGGAKAPAAFDSAMGFVPDTGPREGAVQGIVDSGAHTFTKPDSFADGVARARTGASTGNKGTQLEINPPDMAKLLRLATERLDKARQAVTEAQTEFDALGPEPVGPKESVPIPPEINDLLIRYTTQPSVAEPTVYGAVGKEFHSLGEIVDAIESIDAGARPFDNSMTDAEMQTLRQGLLDWMQKRIESNPRRGKAKRVQPAQSADDHAAAVSEAMQALELAVKPAEGPLTGFEGTQYELGFLPKREESGLPLSPRILSTVSTLDLLRKASPDLPAELAVGRKQTLPARIASARFASFFDTLGDRLERMPGGRVTRFMRKQLEANPQHDLHRATIDRFIRRLVGDEPEIANEAALEKWNHDYDTAHGIISALHREMALAENTLLKRFRLHRSEYTLTAGKFERVARQHLSGKVEYVDADLPDWAQAFIAQSKSETPFFDAWAEADNRIRQWFREQPNGASKYVEALYASKRARGASRVQAKATQLYHTFRFLLDGRWIALEMVEAPTLTLFQEGVGAVMDAMGITRQGTKIKRGVPAPQPYLLNIDQASQLRAEWAYWLAPDVASSQAYRMNYILSLVRNQQASELPELMRQLAMRDPELAKTLRTFGDNPKQWLERIDADWQMADHLRRVLKPEEAEAIYGQRFKDGIITEKEYNDVLDAARKGEYHYVKMPAIEAAIAESVGNPVLEPMMRLLQHRTEVAWNDAMQTIFGQPNRSNVQRLLNHPMLFWPISYQIKATKWLAGLMFDRFMGVDTGAYGALVLDRIHQQHVEQFRDDPNYRKFFDDNKTLLFVASMFFPITPWDIGVGLSPFTRLAVATAAGAFNIDDPNIADYKRNIFSVGPGYTYFNLLPRLGWELRRSPFTPAQMAGDVIGGIFGNLNIQVEDKARPSTSQQVQATNQEYSGPQPPVTPFNPPPQRYQP